MKLLLICEGTRDDEDLTALTLKVLHESHEWMVGLESLSEPTPTWLEYEPGRRFLRWGDVDVVCERWRVPPVQRLGKGLGYRAALRALRLLSVLPSRSETAGVRVVMVHDSDRVEGWLASLDLARREWLSALASRVENLDADVAVGVAHPEHEAWKLVAFEPGTATELTALNAARARLGFDPRTEGESLTSKRVTDPKDAKRVLEEVCVDHERRRTLLAGASLELLRNRGGSVGLTAFLEELKTHVASAYGHLR